MLLAAVIFDLLSLVPFLNVFTTIIAVMVMGLLGVHTGNSLYSGGRILGTVLTSLIELIPGASMFPTWTIRVLILKWYDV